MYMLSKSMNRILLFNYTLILSLLLTIYKALCIVCYSSQENGQRYNWYR